MKKFFIDVETSGLDVNLDGIIHMAGTIDIDNTIMETFNFKCKPFSKDKFTLEVMKKYNLTWGQWVADPERISVTEAMENLLGYLDKYVDRYNRVDKFQFIGYDSYALDMPFMRNFFLKMDQTCFNSYFWSPPIDVKLTAAFMLEGIRSKLSNFNLDTIAAYFGFDVSYDRINDAFYRVGLIRNLYYILERFRTPLIYCKKVQLN